MGDRETAQAFIRQAEQTAADTSKPSYTQLAYQLFASACMADPTFANAFYLYGNHNSDLKCPDAAIASWRRALECGGSDKESRSKILSNLGWHLEMKGETEEALACLQEALALTPTEPIVLANLSMVYRDMGNVPMFVSCARLAYNLDSAEPQFSMALAFACLFDGQYAEGFRHFEKRFEWRLHNFTQFPYDKWKGEPDRVVFLVADQGLGDTLSFSRFIPLVASRSKYVHVCVQPELIRLFQHCFIKYPNINIIPMGQSFPSADAWTSFVSLPFALGLTDDEIKTAQHVPMPVFSPGKGWKVPDRKIHIGIQWGGSALNDIDRHRNIPFEQFLELYRVPGVQLYSFQMDARSEEMHLRGSAGLIRDMKGYVSDVVDTMSFLRELDLVICCESALGHIAAAADVECWIPYSRLGLDYRAGVRGEKKLWCPKHTYFQQGADAQWGPVFAKIVEELGRLK